MKTVHFIFICYSDSFSLGTLINTICCSFYTKQKKKNIRVFRIKCTQLSIVFDGIFNVFFFMLSAYGLQVFHLKRKYYGVHAIIFDIS